MAGDVPRAPIGVILHSGRSGSEALLERFATALRDQGVAVGGLIQRSEPLPNGHSRMELVDIVGGQRYLISQDLGPGSSSCCLDPRGLAEASEVLRREIARNPALMIVNKFAGSESEGKGLLMDMFDAVAHGIPVLTCVSQRYKAQWDLLTGGAGTMLAPEDASLWAWWSSIQ